MSNYEPLRDKLDEEMKRTSRKIHEIMAVLTITIGVLIWFIIKVLHLSSSVNDLSNNVQDLLTRTSNLENNEADLTETIQNLTSTIQSITENIDEIQTSIEDLRNLFDVINTTNQCLANDTEFFEVSADRQSIIIGGAVNYTAVDSLFQEFNSTTGGFISCTLLAYGYSLNKTNYVFSFFLDNSSFNTFDPTFDMQYGEYPMWVWENTPIAFTQTKVVTPGAHNITLQAKYRGDYYGYFNFQSARMQCVLEHNCTQINQTSFYIS